MIVEGTDRGTARTLRRQRPALASRVARVVRRLGWGVADQAISSLTNFAVTIYVAREMGAATLGAFGLASVTYSFAVSASRGLATDPFMVRFSGGDTAARHRAVAESTGTALAIGLTAGVCALGADIILRGSARAAFLALGLTLPALVLQDSWRFAFFGMGRGSLAFLNDLIWGLGLLPALLILRAGGIKSVFWCVFAWGATGVIAAAVGPVQARNLPRISSARNWLSHHRDLGYRYLVENSSGGAATQLRAYGLGLFLGLAALGYVQAAATLIGPVMVVFQGMSLVTIPEAVRVLQRSPKYFVPFCLIVSVGLATVGMAWGGVLMVALPSGLGAMLLGSVWRHTYPLVLFQTLAAVGLGATAGAVAGLHALGAAQRSVRAALPASTLYVILTLIGAARAGAVGAMAGTAAATWLGALLEWWQLRGALRARNLPGRYRGRHASGSRDFARADHERRSH